MSASATMVEVSVISTVLNERGSVASFTQSLLAQSRRPAEIVIVDGGSTDGTFEFLQELARANPIFHAISKPGANISRGRNVAIAEARGEVIAATDAGTRLSPRWLERLIAPFEEAGRGESGALKVDVVSGAFRSAPESVFEWALGETTLPHMSEIKAETFLPSSRSVAFTKQAWREAGGYPEWLDYCEDVVFDLALRHLGKRFVFAPEALVYFQPRPTMKAFYKQYYRYARGDGKANLWLKRHLIRYSTYLISVLAFRAGFWYKRVWLLLFGAGIIYLSRPYRRLWASREYIGFGQTGPELIQALGIAPLARLIGDVAKMAGYPVGVFWRIKRRLRIQ